MNENTPARQPKGRIFISKAVILLCMAKKSRDADHLRNYGYDKLAGLTPETLADELHGAGDYVPIPDHAFDCHTARGEKMGRIKADFFKAEQASLEPGQPGPFNDLVNG